VARLKEAGIGDGADFLVPKVCNVSS
jgi:hypothetical protein